jgi:3-dehydroquinate synthase
MDRQDREMAFSWKTAASRTTVEFLAEGEMRDLSRHLSGDWKNPFLIIDSTVRRLWDELLQPAILSASGIYVMDSEEITKNTFTLSQIWDSMASAGIGRDTPVVVVGGGLVCDIGAMAASTFMRGLRLMLVPTTLLCMVDACLGGKTGVNLSGAKNQIGTFYPARRIAVSVSFLRTLPEREFRSGMAEVIKTALIGDRHIRELIEGMDTVGEPGADVLETVERCLRVKGSVVESDLLDRKGRMILNLGHTIGHALESASNFRLSHGEAVGLGMLAESAIAVSRGGSSNLPDEIMHLLESVGLPIHVDADLPIDELEDFYSRDKKTMRNGRIWALPFDWCDCRLVRLSAAEEDKILPGILDVLKA